MNYDVPPLCDVHYGPVATVESASVEPDIHSLISHYNYEVGRGSWHVRGTGPTVCRAAVEEMKCKRCSEKPADCHDDKYDHQNPSQKPCSWGPFPARTPSYHSVTTNL